MQQSHVELKEPIEAYEIWADSYLPYAHNPLMKAEERSMLELSPPDLHGLRVLDAGCGTGRYLIHALERGARDLAGVDQSDAMLRRAEVELAMKMSKFDRAQVTLSQSGLDSIPIGDAWADLTYCGLTLGHIKDVAPALRELRRVTKPGGVILCSDIHPIGESLGWERTFRAGIRRYSVSHTWRSLTDWKAACHRVGLTIDGLREPLISADDMNDIPVGANFDPKALQVPVALVLALRRRRWQIWRSDNL